MFMVIGSFAVVTLIGRTGDHDHDIAAYCGLARRQPLLAFVFAVLLLAQAGVPFTTGFLTKFQVVIASVDAHSVPLAVVAMVSAAVAAFFYLRVSVLMYAPSEDGVEDDVEAEPAGGPAVLAMAGGGAAPSSVFEAATANRSRLNAALLLEGDEVEVEPDPEVEVEERTRVAVPLPAVIAIGICVAVTVVFGIIPAPLVDFAHKATLLFLP
jgi:NADH-quinone oxidoreductase subunit N